VFQVARHIITFYRDGFRSMTLGRTLWKIIIIKLVVMFGVLKLFFFPDFLKTHFQDDAQRADYVISVITGQGEVSPPAGGVQR